MTKKKVVTRIDRGINGSVRGVRGRGGGAHLASGDWCFEELGPFTVGRAVHTLHILEAHEAGSEETVGFIFHRSCCMHGTGLNEWKPTASSGLTTPNEQTNDLINGVVDLLIKTLFSPLFRVAQTKQNKENKKTKHNI